MDAIALRQAFGVYTLDLKRATGSSQVILEETLVRLCIEAAEEGDLASAERKLSHAKEWVAEGERITPGLRGRSRLGQALDKFEQAYRAALV